MRIAVIHHTGSFYSNYPLYIASLIEEMAKANESAVYDFRQLKLSVAKPAAKTTIIHISLGAESRWRFYNSYKLQLPAILKKIKPDIVISLHGIVIKTTAVQFVVVPSFIQSNGKGLHTWQKTVSKQSKQYSLHTVKLLCQSNIAKQYLQQQYGKADTAVLFIPFSAEQIFQPLQWHDKIYIKGRFTENNEYFLAAMPYQDEALFTMLLKAFSVFKKWQQSSMRLVLLPFEDGFAPALEEKLETYKYKNHVTILNNADEKETADIVATAYAYIAMNDTDEDMQAVATALQCGLAITGISSKEIKEYAGDAAYLNNDFSYEELGQSLITLYKDENLRSRLAEAALLRAENYKRSDIAENLWKLLTGNASAPL